MEYLWSMGGTWEPKRNMEGKLRRKDPRNWGKHLQSIFKASSKQFQLINHPFLSYLRYFQKHSSINLFSISESEFREFS